MSSVSIDFLKIQKNINFYDSFASKNIFLYIGKPDQWAVNELDSEFIIPTPLLGDQYYKDELKDIISLKKVSTSDVCLGLKRYDWSYNTLYDAYNSYDGTQLKKHFYPGTHPFYIMTDEYNVYKCIDNNNGAFSTVKPSGQFLTNITLSDGYIWKFMYNIPEELRVKFLSTQYIPVVLNSEIQSNQAQYLVKAAAIKGTIDRIEVINGGTGYNSTLGQTEIIITGDGTGAECTPVVTNGVITSVLITNAGTNYTYCNLEIVDNANSANSLATLRAHISPINGHGFNCVSELGSFYTIISVDIIGSENGYFPLFSSYRKSGLISNFLDLADNEINSNLRYYGVKNSAWLDVSQKTSFPSRYLKEQTGELLYINYHQPITRSATQLERIKLVVETI